MQETQPPISQVSIRELLEENPRLAALFFARKMQCPGCPVAKFDTLVDAAREYGLDWEKLCDEFSRANKEKAND